MRLTIWLWKSSFAINLIIQAVRVISKIAAVYLLRTLQTTCMPIFKLPPYQWRSREVIFVPGSNKIMVNARSINGLIASHDLYISHDILWQDDLPSGVVKQTSSIANPIILNSLTHRQSSKLLFTICLNILLLTYYQHILTKTSACEKKIGQ